MAVAIASLFTDVQRQQSRATWYLHLILKHKMKFPKPMDLLLSQKTFLLVSLVRLMSYDPF